MNTGVTNPGSGFMSDPTPLSAGSEYYESFPHDDTVDQKYEFYVKVSTNGADQLWSPLYTLIVGCPTYYTLTQHTGFTTLVEKMVNSNPVGIYKIKVPTKMPGSFPSWCPITYSISNLLLNGGTSVGNEINFQTAQPCLDMDLLTTSYGFILTFNVLAHVGTGPSILTSSLVTIKIKSCLTENTISQDASLVSLMYTWDITNSDPFVSIPAFSFSDSNCPFTSIEIFTDSSATGVSPPPNMSPASVSTNLNNAF